MVDLLMQSNPSIERRRRLAEAMTQRGMQTGPVQHWSEGLARVLNAGAGAYFGNKLAQEESAQRQASMKGLAQALTGNGMAADGMGPPEPLMNRIARVPGVNPEAITMMKLQQEMKSPAERKIIKDAAGRQRYVDSGEYVFEGDIQKPESEIDKLVKMLQAEKLKTDIESKKQDVEAGKKSAEAEFDNIQTAADQLVKAVQHPGFRQNYGKVDATMNRFVPDAFLPQERLDASPLIDQVKNLLTVAARGQLKGQGQITDAETAMLERAQTILKNHSMSDEAAIQEVDRVLTYLQSKGAEIPEEVFQSLRQSLPNQGRSVVAPGSQEPPKQTSESGFSIRRIDQ